jgi:hypothetical protein
VSLLRDRLIPGLVCQAQNPRISRGIRRCEWTFWLSKFKD